MLTLPILVSSFKSTRLEQTRFLGLGQNPPPQPSPGAGEISKMSLFIGLMNADDTSLKEMKKTYWNVSFIYQSNNIFPWHRTSLTQKSKLTRSYERAFTWSNKSVHGKMGLTSGDEVVYALGDGDSWLKTWWNSQEAGLWRKRPWYINACMGMVQNERHLDYLFCYFCCTHYFRVFFSHQPFESVTVWFSSVSK